MIHLFAGGSTNFSAVCLSENPAAFTSFQPAFL
jgi:hypothetical protein